MAKSLYPLKGMETWQKRIVVAHTCLDALSGLCIIRGSVWAEWSRGGLEHREWRMYLQRRRRLISDPMEEKYYCPLFFYISSAYLTGEVLLSHWSRKRKYAASAGQDQG